MICASLYFLNLPQLTNTVYLCVQLLQSCPILDKPMGCIPPGSSVHGILQARILERGLPFAPPGDLPHPGIEPMSPALQADSLLLSHRENLNIYYACIEKKNYS